MGVERGMLTRLLHVEGAAVIVHVWVRRDGPVVLHAAAAREPAPGHALEVAVERMRFALGLDDDLREFYDAFRGDRLLGPAIRQRPWLRPRRQAWPWDALAWRSPSS
jgi:hypothetical protein